MLALIAGVAFGFLGIMPFVHTNLLLQLFQSMFGNPLDDAVFATALAFSHLAFEPVPALLLCVPTMTQNVSVLPGHAMVLKGEGARAFRSMLSSLVFSALLALAAAPIAFILLPQAFEAVKPFVPLGLAAVFIAMFWGEGSLGKAARTFVPFALAGAFGLVALNSAMVREPLFPVLTGLFGIPAIMLALPPREKAAAGKTAEPADSDGVIEVKPRLVALGCALGAASVLLPALSPALVAGVVFTVMERRPEEFLSLTSSIVGSRAVFEIVALASIGKARSGSSAAVANALGGVSFNELALLTVAGIVALCLGTAAVLLLYKKIVGSARRLNSSRANAALLAFVAGALLFVSGPLGVLMAAVAAAIGVLPPLMKTNRSCLMAALIVPAIAYYV
jgi:putative membrane protein